MDLTIYSWNINWQKWAGMGLNGFIFKKINQNQNFYKALAPWGSIDHDMQNTGLMNSHYLQQKY